MPIAKFASKPILEKKVLTKCHSEVSEIADAYITGGRWLKIFKMMNERSSFSFI
jgi:hypothetical protein